MAKAIHLSDKEKGFLSILFLILGVFFIGWSIYIFYEAKHAVDYASIVANAPVIDPANPSVDNQLVKFRAPISKGDFIKCEYKDGDFLEIQTLFYKYVEQEETRNKRRVKVQRWDHIYTDIKRAHNIEFGKISLVSGAAEFKTDLYDLATFYKLPDGSDWTSDFDYNPVPLGSEKKEVRGIYGTGDLTVVGMLVNGKISGGDPFIITPQTIDDLIASMKKEQVDDYSFRRFCSFALFLLGLASIVPSLITLNKLRHDYE